MNFHEVDFFSEREGFLVVLFACRLGRDQSKLELKLPMLIDLKYSPYDFLINFA